MPNRITSLKRLTFFLGGYDATNAHIEISEGAVTFAIHYKPFSEDFRKYLEQTKTIVSLPTMIETLNEIDVLNWKSSYSNNYILDGIQWELFIQYNGNLKKRITGSNNFPGSKANSYRYSSAFDKLVKVLELTIGKRIEG